MNSPEDLPPSATPADLLAAEPITHILFQAVTKLESLDNDEHAAALQHESDNMDLPRKKKTFSALLQESNIQVGFNSEYWLHCHSYLRVSRTKIENLRWQIGGDINFIYFRKFLTSLVQQGMLFSIVPRFSYTWFLLCLEWLDADWLSSCVCLEGLHSDWFCCMWYCYHAFSFDECPFCLVGGRIFCCACILIGWVVWRRKMPPCLKWSQIVL